jgi:site-specific DNA recombinase
MKLNQRRKPPVGKYMLAGVLTCPECGSKMVGSKTKYKTKNGPVERLYYTCSQFHNKGLTACHANGIRVDLIDPIAIKKIAKKLNSPELVDTLYKYITENTIDENSVDGKRRILEIEIEKLQKRKIELRKLYTDGIINSDELVEDIDNIKSKTTEYESLITELENDTELQKSRSITITKQDVESFLSDIATTLKTTDESERLTVKMLIRSIVSRIEIKSKHKVDMDIEINYEEAIFRLLGAASEV